MFKKHKDEHQIKQDVFNCSKCDKTFNEDWKLNAHMKLHKNYQCDQCSKNVKYEDLMRKHVKIYHENVKMYCHYFKNKKSCSYTDDFVFLHQESNFCKYGMLFERMFCLFKHENEQDEEHDEVEENSENYDIINYETKVIDEDMHIPEEPCRY